MNELPRRTRQEAIDEFARNFRQMRITRDSLPPEEAAQLAYEPGGPSVEEIEAKIRRHRAEARAELEAKKATEQHKEAA